MGKGETHTHTPHTQTLQHKRDMWSSYLLEHLTQKRRAFLTHPIVLALWSSFSDPAVLYDHYSIKFISDIPGEIFFFLIKRQK